MQTAKSVEFKPVDTDRYGRTVAHVWCDGVHVNWRQVQAGLAWCFTKYLKHPDECLPAERTARAERRGLWREPSPAAAVGVQSSKAHHTVAASVDWLWPAFKLPFFKGIYYFSQQHPHRRRCQRHMQRFLMQ